MKVLADRNGSWCTDDTILAAGLVEYEASRVDHLGLPKRLTEAGNAEGWWEMRTRFNAAEQAKVLWEQDSGKDMDPGSVPYLVDTRTED